MRATLALTALLLGLCLIGCSRNYIRRQIRVVGDGISETVPGALVDGEFFRSSGAKPYLGRLFAEAEFQPDRSAVAVVSYRFWRDTFHANPKIIGSRVQLDGRPTIIVGVAEPEFAPSGAGEIWIPKS